MITSIATNSDLEMTALQREERVPHKLDQFVPTFSLSQWQMDSIKEILRLSQLPQDWDSYGSPPPDPNMIASLVSLIESIPIDDLPTPRIVPVPGGGLQVEWRVKHRELELTAFPREAVEFLKIERDRPCDEGQVLDKYHVFSLLAWLLAS